MKNLAFSYGYRSLSLSLQHTGSRVALEEKFSDSTRRILLSKKDRKRKNPKPDRNFRRNSFVE